MGLKVGVRVWLMHKYLFATVSGFGNAKVYHMVCIEKFENSISTAVYATAIRYNLKSGTSIIFGHYSVRVEMKKNIHNILSFS